MKFLIVCLLLAVALATVAAYPVYYGPGYYGVDNNRDGLDDRADFNLDGKPDNFYYGYRGYYGYPGRGYGPYGLPYLY